LARSASADLRSFNPLGFRGEPEIIPISGEPRGRVVSIRSGSGGNPRSGIREKLIDIYRGFNPLGFRGEPEMARARSSASSRMFQSARVPGGTRDGFGLLEAIGERVSIRSGSGGNPRSRGKPRGTCGACCFNPLGFRGEPEIAAIPSGCRPSPVSIRSGSGGNPRS